VQAHRFGEPAHLKEPQGAGSEATQPQATPGGPDGFRDADERTERGAVHEVDLVEVEGDVGQGRRPGRFERTTKQLPVADVQLAGQRNERQPVDGRGAEDATTHDVSCWFASH